VQVFLYQNFRSRFDRIVSASFFKTLGFKQRGVAIRAFNYTDSIALNIIGYLFFDNLSSPSKV